MPLVSIMLDNTNTDDCKKKKKVLSCSVPMQRDIALTLLRFSINLNLNQLALLDFC